jgi:hypothetical protein
MASELEDFLDSLIERPRDVEGSAPEYDRKGRLIPRAGFLVFGEPMTSEELEAAFGGEQPLSQVWFINSDGMRTEMGKYRERKGNEKGNLVP